MERGGKILVSAAALAAASCGGESGKLEIRSTPTPLAQGARPVSYRIAEARGQLALGNVALALESFRKARRDDPNSADALAGMAECYDRMGRFDLSRRNYEAALALAPADARLLGAFAGSLDLQGRGDEALKVRQEIAARAAIAAPPVQQAADALPVQQAVAPAPAQRAVAPAPVQALAAAPASPKRQPPAAIAPVQPQQPPPVRAAALPARSVPVPPSPAPALEGTKIAAPPSGVVDVALRAPKVPERLRVEVPVMPEPVIVAARPEPAPTASSVTVKLPPPRPASAPAPKVAAAEPVRKEAEATPVTVAMRPPAATTVEPTIVSQMAAIAAKGPRLERLSMGEIALITNEGPVWRPATVARSARSTTVKFVPLREASASPVRVRLLNAARVHRLAARTRTWLAARGWRGMAIGDAPVTRARSLVLYPAGKRDVALRLSAKFGFAMRERASGSQVIVLLGRDAARISALKPVRA